MAQISMESFLAFLQRQQAARRMSAATTVGITGAGTNLLLVGRRRSSTVSVDSAAYLPQHLAVREWQG